MSLEEDSKMLSDFGLTHVQAKIYLTIVKLSLASAGQISKVSKVRREDVYRNLPKLEKMGLVERALGTPLKLRATPVEEALTILVKREQDLASQKVSMLTAKKDLFLKSFKRDRVKLVLEEETQFIMLSRKDVLSLRTMIMIKNAEKEISVLTSRETAIRFIQNYSGNVEKALKKGVNIRVITEMPEYEDLLLKLMTSYKPNRVSLQLKCTNQLPCQCMICDNKETIIAASRESLWEEGVCLWTNNQNLVEVMQRNFEDTWLTSVSVRSIETDAVRGKVIGFVKKLEPTSHVIFVYDSIEAKHNILFHFLKAGLDKGEAAVYVTTEETPSEIREAMMRLGVDVEKYEKADALRILRYTDVYLKNEKFNLPIIMDFWNRTYKESLTKGFKGLRATGEMSCFFKHNMIQELMEYERALHRVLDIPMAAICAYNSELLCKTRNPINLYSELIKAHGTALFTGIDKKVGKMELKI